MGNCCCGGDNKFPYHISLKFPNGRKGIRYNQEKEEFEEIENIDTWIQSLYKNSSFSSFVVYNDDTEHIGTQSHTKGHCKGIVAWNKKRISWLIHSLPNFPKEFDGESISEIEKGETIYAQSFVYIEVENEGNIIEEILKRLYIMEAHIYMSNYDYKKKKKEIRDKIFYNLSLIGTEIAHISKPSCLEKDIYSDYLNHNEEGEKWLVETWKRGHEIDKKCKNIKDINEIKYKDVEWKDTQDHSKWAVSEHYVWIGDLNRMTSQFKRGGGGIIIKNEKLAKAFRQLVKS